MVYVCVCVYIYIYIYIGPPALRATAGGQATKGSKAWQLFIVMFICYC